jgi:hypothetical protein
MGLFDRLFGRRGNDVDWLTLNLTKWSELGEDDNGIEHSIDRLSCYQAAGVVWWNHRNGVEGQFYQYMLCGSNVDDGPILIAVLRTLEDPSLTPLKPDQFKQMVRPGMVPLFDKGKEQAKIWSQFNQYKTPTPASLYGLSIMNKDD